MASFTTLPNGSIRAQIRRAGQKSVAKTFKGQNAKLDAEAWASGLEKDIRDGKTAGDEGIPGKTFGQAVARYVLEKPSESKSVKSAFKRMDSALGSILLTKLTDQHILDYIQGLGVGPATGAFHWSHIRGVLARAKIFWRWAVADVLEKAQGRLKYGKLIEKSNERDRIPTKEELELLYAHDWKTEMPMVDIIKFAIASAMRQAEITRVTFQETKFTKDQEETLIRDRKHPTKKLGNHQWVPLLQEAVEIIERQPRNDPDGRIFPYLPESIGNKFRKGCKKLGIEDLHFHDLRHLGATRLFEMGYQIHEVALFTGHTDWKMLERYTHLKAKDLRRLDAAKPKKKVKQKEEVIDVPKAVEGGVTVDAEMFKRFQQFEQMQKMMEMMKAGELA